MVGLLDTVPSKKGLSNCQRMVLLYELGIQSQKNSTEETEGDKKKRIEATEKLVFALYHGVRVPKNGRERYFEMSFRRQMVNVSLLARDGNVGSACTKLAFYVADNMNIFEKLYCGFYQASKFSIFLGEN